MTVILLTISIVTRKLIVRTLVAIVATLTGLAHLYLNTFRRDTIEARARKGFVPQEYINGVTDAVGNYAHIQAWVSVVLIVLLLIALRSLFDAHTARIKK